MWVLRIFIYFKKCLRTLGSNFRFTLVVYLISAVPLQL